MLTRSEERLLIALRQRAQREKRQLFLAEGVRVVEELVAAGFAIELAVVTPSLAGTPRGQALAAALMQRSTAHEVADHVLARVAATESPQGVLAVARMPAVTLATLDVGNGLGLVLDGIQDPGNVGTLVRSAFAFGATFVLLLGGTVDAWNPKAVRASAGTAFRIALVHTEAEAAIPWLRAHGSRILVADAQGEDIARVARARRLVLVLGNEGAGVSESVRASADALVAVPIREGAESLNVAAAAAVLLYALTRGEEVT